METVVPFALIFAPIAFSIISVWLRETKGSVIVVIPFSTFKPARRMQDLTCAEAILDL